MNNEEGHVKNFKLEKTLRDSKNILKYIEPAIFVTLLTSGMYFIGYAYVKKFFVTLAIDHAAIDLPFAYYVTQSLYPVLYLVLFLVVGLYEPFKPPKNKWDSIRKNIPSWVIIAAMFWKSLNALHIRGATFYFLATICFLIFTIYDCINMRSFIQRAVSSMSLRLLGVLAMFWLAVAIAVAKGRIEAERIIKRGKMFIEFTLRDELSDLHSKQFTYIIHRDDKYYVLESSRSTPEDPKLIIIPDNEVIKAVVYHKK